LVGLFQGKFPPIFGQEKGKETGGADRHFQEGIPQLFFARKLPTNRTRIPIEIQRSATVFPTPKSRSKDGEQFLLKMPGR
jgi:hypothetical protein